MEPHTITGWISFAAVVASSTVTVITAVRMTFDARRRQRGDRQDVVTAVTFATLTLMAGLLFLVAEGRP